MSVARSENARIKADACDNRRVTNCLWCKAFISGDPVQGRYCSDECFDRDCEVTARFFCVACDRDTVDEYCMLHDELWLQTGIPPNGGMLCFRCIEARIGRPLRLSSTDSARSHIRIRPPSESCRFRRHYVRGFGAARRAA